MEFLLLGALPASAAPAAQATRSPLPGTRTSGLLGSHRCELCLSGGALVAPHLLWRELAVNPACGGHCG